MKPFNIPKIPFLFLSALAAVITFFTFYYSMWDRGYLGGYMLPQVCIFSLLGVGVFQAFNSMLRSKKIDPKKARPYIVLFVLIGVELTHLIPSLKERAEINNAARPLLKLIAEPTKNIPGTSSTFKSENANDISLLTTMLTDLAKKHVPLIISTYEEEVEVVNKIAVSISPANIITADGPVFVKKLVAEYKDHVSKNHEFQMAYQRELKEAFENLNVSSEAGDGMHDGFNRSQPIVIELYSELTDIKMLKASIIFELADLIEMNSSSVYEKDGRLYFKDSATLENYNGILADLNLVEEKEASLHQELFEHRDNGIEKIRNATPEVIFDLSALK